MWAVGVICYELVTLHMPFPATTCLDLFVQVTETEPDWDRWTGFSQELFDVARRLLQKDACSRPSARGVLEEALFLDAPDVADEIWAVVAARGVPDLVGKVSDSKDIFQKTSSSQASTAVGSDASPCPSVMVTEKRISLSLDD